ncbi:immunoglobulin-like domain-containing protein [Alkalitalea saponilacus]|uniref:Glycosyl hydrolases family 43 n=1 Tax=Alkalitalea saponilacus TaxID=889453 RepID=A0A1T5AG52_9BACT|nr:immunoglobulin-like domain-containing protein [Alkalitalea saponilacus]ASB48714.1 hypothetical protein CDL62_05935 [Alkalitalea saponilacus]SKB33954.1 Glycosyl hydrolases family 43 [Alkalitalea saponilacus]
MMIKRFYWLLLAVLFYSTTSCQTEEGLVLHYDFSRTTGSGNVVRDASGNGYSGEVHNNAFFESLGRIGILNLGSENGFLDMGAKTGELISSLEDFTVATYLYVDELTDLTAHGNFLWNFGNSDNLAVEQNGSMFFSARTTGYTISRQHWSGEQGAARLLTFPKGQWHHVAYVQKGNIGTIYLNGSRTAESSVTILPSVLGKTTHNYIGRSSYRGDAFLRNAKVADFRVYNRALSNEEMERFRNLTNKLQRATIDKQLKSAAQTALPGSFANVVENLELPSVVEYGVSVKWSSSKPDVLSDEGAINRPAEGSKAASVTLTGLFTKNGQSYSEKYTVVVQPWLSERASVEKDIENITLIGNVNNLRTDMILPVSGIEGTTIRWESSHREFLSDNGKLINLSPIGEGKKLVTLTAHVSKGSESKTRDFEVYVAEDEGYVAYLFSYFIGNGPGEEAIFYSISHDGYNFRALNNNRPIITADTISARGGVRDPHILRAPDGYFYMVVTDLYVPNDGWSGNDAMVFLRSSDLVNWTHAKINIADKFEEFSDVLRVWAPQSYYDEEKGKVMVYWSMLQPGGYDIIYYAYANEDFTGLETVPKQLLYHPDEVACIDGDIVYKDGVYHLFFKTEGAGNGIKKAVSDRLTEGYVVQEPYLQQTNDAVEGSCVYRLINTDTYILMYDVYSRGSYQFTKSTDLENFEVIDHKISMNFYPRHGTVIPINQEELNNIMTRWGR